MTDREKSYYLRRAEEEFAAAEAATLPVVREIHRELAERYSALVQPEARTPAAERQRIAASFDLKPASASNSIAA